MLNKRPDQDFKAFVNAPKFLMSIFKNKSLEVILSPHEVILDKDSKTRQIKASLSLKKIDSELETFSASISIEIKDELQNFMIAGKFFSVDDSHDTLKIEAGIVSGNKQVVIFQEVGAESFAN